MRCIRTNGKWKTKWSERRKTEDRKLPSREKLCSAETNLLTARLPLRGEKSDSSTPLNSPAAQAHTHTELSPLLYRTVRISCFFFHSISHYSQALGLRDIDWQPQPEMSFRAVMFDRCWKNTDHWSGRLNELLLYIHTFISLYFLDHTHVTFFLDKHILHFCGFRVKSSKQRTVGGCA